MDIPGPSSRRFSMAQFTREESAERTYEDDLLRLLEHLTPDEIDEFQTLFAQRMQRGYPPSDRDVAMMTLLQQVHELVNINEDRALAQRIAGEEDVGVGTEQSTDGRTESDESGHGGEIGTETDESTDVEDVGIESEENVQRFEQGRAQPIRNRIARFLPRRGISLITRLFGSKLLLMGRARVALPRMHRPTGHDCVACQDAIYGAEIRAPCGHFYDVGCATNLFQSATRDETLFPPRCCGKNIPFTRIRSHFSRSLITTLQEKRAEFSTLKRVYCYSPTCSRFLGPVSEGIFGGRVYTCPALGCHRRTCGKCREEHSGDRSHVCCPDAGAAEVLELSRASGWARCPGCAHMIGLHLGCFHTTCRCGTEFCYLCRAPWKTCGCPQWEEERLVADGEVNEE